MSSGWTDIGRLTQHAHPTILELHTLHRCVLHHLYAGLWFRPMANGCKVQNHTSAHIYFPDALFLKYDLRLHGKCSAISKVFFSTVECKLPWQTGLSKLKLVSVGSKRTTQTTDQSMNARENQHKTKYNWRPFHTIIVGSWHEDTHLNGASRSETVRSIQYRTGFLSAPSRLRVIDDASVDNTIYYQWGIIQYWTTPTIRTFKPFLMVW